MTITEFLLERIGEIEAKVQEGVDQADIDGDKRRFYSEAAAMRDDWGLWVFHIPPARVLAECEAKRAIVEKRLAIGLPDRPIGDGQAWLSGAHEAVDAERGHLLRTLAAVYADHPDYRQEWKPEK